MSDLGPNIFEPSIHEYASVLAQLIVRDAEHFNKTLVHCESAGIHVTVEVVNGNRLRVAATMVSREPAPVAKQADAGDLKPPALEACRFESGPEHFAGDPSQVEGMEAGNLIHPPPTGDAR